MKVVKAHPCPTPNLSKRQRFVGCLWACSCGRVYIQRWSYTYAGEDWDWVLTELRTGVEET